MGVRQNTPELEAAFQQILKACKTHNVACAITATSGNDVAKRVKEGWKIIRSTVPAITAGRACSASRRRPLFSRAPAFARSALRRVRRSSLDWLASGGGKASAERRPLA